MCRLADIDTSEPCLDPQLVAETTSITETHMCWINYLKHRSGSKHVPNMRNGTDWKRPGTWTMRDSSCSTDACSLGWAVALIICLFITPYLCSALWCSWSTPFSWRSHRSYRKIQLDESTFSYKWLKLTQYTESRGNGKCHFICPLDALFSFNNPPTTKAAFPRVVDWLGLSQ